MPGGLAAVGLFGGALVLAVLAVVGVAGIVSMIGTNLGEGVTAVLTVLAFGAAAVVLASGAALVGLLGRADPTLAQATRQAAETGTRLQVLVEHVPAAVYIDTERPQRVGRRPARPT